MISSEKIKGIIHDLKISQEDFAEKVKVSPEYLSRVINNKVPVSHKFETKLKELGYLQQEKTAPDNLTEAEKHFFWLKDYLNLSDEEAATILEKLKDDKLPYLLLAKIQATGDKQSVKLLKFLFPVLND